MRRQGARTALLRAFLMLFMAAAPTVTWGFSILPLPSSSTTHHPLPRSHTIALASQRQPAGGDAGGEFIGHSYDGESESEDPYLKSLKRGQAGRTGAPPASRGPVTRTSEEIKAMNDAAKARMEAYARGELPPGFGTPAQAPAGLPPSTPSSPEGFNPNKFMDFYREHEAKLAAENAAKVAETAARAPPLLCVLPVRQLWRPLQNPTCHRPATNSNLRPNKCKTSRPWLNKKGRRRTTSNTAARVLRGSSTQPPLLPAATLRRRD